MRLVILKDTKITEDEINELERQLTDLYFEHAGIEPEYYNEPRNFSNYPTYIDSDGDIRPSGTYLREVTNTVYKRYGQWGTDHVVFLIHEDNWKSDDDTFRGIWGTAWAFVFGSYLTEYVRFDRDNMANSLGTLYHETGHPLDVLIKVELGIDINPIVETELRKRYTDNINILDYLDEKGFEWDRDYIHGGLPKPFGYIRHKEGVEILEIVSPYLKQAYKLRKEKHTNYMLKQKVVISLLQKVVYLYRKLLNKKDGVPRS